MTEEGVIDLESPEVPEEVSSPVEAPPEKMLSVSRVNELVKKAKLKGRDSMQQELDDLRRENESLKTQQPSMGGQGQAIDIDAFRKQVYDDLMAQLQNQQESQAQEQLQKEAEKLAADYHGKMASGKESFDDFDEIMADFNPAAFPQLVYLANQTDNTQAVMYEIAKNPNKLAQLSYMSERDPKAAQNMMNKLSQSIKANQQAQAQEQSAGVKAPLGRMQSSPVGQDIGSQGNLSMRDLKAMFKG